MRRFILLSMVMVLLGMGTNCWASFPIINRKIRIGYLEAGPYWIYEGTFKAFKDSLIKKGWGDKVVFVKNAHFSPGWGPEHKAEYVERAKELMTRKDIDFVIAMGTAATAALLKVNNGSKPILAMAVADPVASGFVKSIHDSGIDNFTVRIVPNRWKIMFEVFYDVVQFKRLGIIYPDTAAGRVYSNVEDAHEVAKEKHFKVLEYKISSAEGFCECERGIKDLIKRGMDAFFIPPLNCFDWTKSNVEKLLNLLNDHKIPTFARDGSLYVRAGALMGFSTMDFGPVGDFLANMAIQIFKGVPPRKVNMIDKASPKIAVNLETALKIGFDFPVSILIASDEIYEKTQLPKNRKFK